MPSASFVETDGADSNIRGGHAEARTRNVEPLVDSGSLNAYLHRDLTPVIGREYEGLQVKYLIEADQQLIHDLAVTSQYSSSGTQTYILKITSFTTRSGISKRPRCDTARNEDIL